MREVAIIGVGQSEFGKFPLRNVLDLGCDAVMRALKDAGISPKDLQIAYSSHAQDTFPTGQAVLMEVGVTSIEIINVQNVCCSGSTAVRALWKDVASGFYDIGIAMGVESMTSKDTGTLLAPKVPYDLDSQIGMTLVGLFSLIANRQMYQHGAALEDFARVSVKNHRHGSFNPYAQYNKVCTLEEVLNSRVICDPLTLLECCPQTDGAAALIMCSMEVARKFTSKPVRIIGSALVSGDYRARQNDITFNPLVEKTAKMAYEMAGCGPEDIDLVEIHDAFAPEEIMRYEELGFCEKGEGIKLLRSGATEIGGKIPFNPSGGLLAVGHPLAASGVRNIGEVALQLRGQAAARQVTGCKVGLAQMMGGFVSDMEIAASTVHILAI